MIVPRSVPFARLAGWLVALASAGCNDGLPEPLTVLCYDVEPGLRASAKVLSVFVFDMAGNLVFDDERYVGADDPDVDYPVTLPVAAAGGNAMRFFTVDAMLLDENRFDLARSSARTRFREDGERGFVRLRFDDACREQFACGPGQTCIAGACELGCFAPTTSDCADSSGAPTPPGPCVETR